MGYLISTLKKLNNTNRNRRTSAIARNRFRHQLRFEQLEERRLLAGVIPNDPDFAQQWAFHNTGQTGGNYDADIDMPAAWSITTGRMTTVVGVLDSGIDYTHPDLYLNIWLNEGEIPAAIAASLTDVDGDGIFTFRDLNATANAPFVTNVNGNGYIDGGDLLNDARWENGVDEDNNGKSDDLIGWDFHDNDNDPYADPAINDHGTVVSQRIAAIGNDGVGRVGVMWRARLINVRVMSSGADRSDENSAAGLDYAVAEGATISNNSYGNYTSSQVMFDAIDWARLAGHLFVTAAGNDSTNNDVSPFYPASYNLDNIIAVTSVNEFDQLAKNWGQVTVDLGAPSDYPGNATSKATPNVSGVAGLLRTLHPLWTYAQIKAQILATVESLPSLAGKCVTGGRLNAAMALATTSISISDPSINESDSGNSQFAFIVTREGDDTGSLTLNWSTANGTATAGSDYVASSGQVTFLPSGGNTKTINVNLNCDVTAEANETFFVNLSVAFGNAVLADELGQATMLDNDTKFYVANDGSLDRTYEYGANSSAGENYALATGNSAPRGAASTAAGSRVWVVDANKKVYVYNTSGVLLGSWTAGGLHAQAQIEGIATNGTDIWLVDNKQDKVFKYAGAASLLSGSQNAASSFNLISGNASPKDIVTDGSSLWVVNDSTTDKVFKYTVAGALVGSWTITTSGAGSPTGITIDPSNVSDVWIVDASAGKVFQYTTAASRTSGSQSAASTFLLATGNTNPQGIADPPPSSARLDDASISAVKKASAVASPLDILSAASQWSRNAGASTAWSLTTLTSDRSLDRQSQRLAEFDLLDQSADRVAVSSPTTDSNQLPKARLTGKVSGVTTANANDDAWRDDDLFETLDDALLEVLAQLPQQP